MTFISWPSDFALYRRPFQIGRHHTWILVQSDIINDLILFVGHCDLYFMVLWFCPISLALSYS